MRIQRMVTVTVYDQGIRRAADIQLQPCPHCPHGVQVYMPASAEHDNHIGHLRTGKSPGVFTGRPVAALVSGGCPGDVGISTAHGIVQRAEYRTAAFVRGLRTLVRLAD